MCRILERQIAEKFSVRPLVFEASLTAKQRDVVFQKFDRDPARQVQISSLCAGGVGLNLTAANHCIMFDQWYNPSMERQAEDRAFRIGQKRKIFVHKFICMSTFEERIDRMIKAKRELTDLTIGAGEQ